MVQFWRTPNNFRYKTREDKSPKRSFRIVQSCIFVKNFQKFWTRILTKKTFHRWILIRFPVSGFFLNLINWWYPVLSPKLCILKLKRENYWISILSLDASFQDSDLESFEIFRIFHRANFDSTVLFMGDVMCSGFQGGVLHIMWRFTV